MGKKIRLNSVGYIDATAEGVEISPSVYERPVMMVYCGDFDSMDGPVTITENHIDLLVKNHNSLIERLKRLVNGDLQMKDCPPLQLDHSALATHTIGRVVGPLTKGFANIDGEEKVALFGRARFLGGENVEKARDGRYTHVSIGADLEDGVLNELSVTPFPAAPRASLLAKNKEEETQNNDHEKGEKNMHEKLKKHLMDSKKMSEKDAEEMSKKVMSHAMKKLGMDEDKMSKHLADCDDKEMSRMSAEHDEDEKKLAKMSDEDEKKKEEEEKEKEAKMASTRSEFTRLALGIRKGTSEVSVELRRSSIASKLSKLRSEGKITPAELRKLDTVKMAGMSDEMAGVMLATFDAREPVVRFGSLAGTNKAENIEAITKKYRMARIELESRMNMSLKNGDIKAKLAKLSEDEKKELSEAGEGKEEPSKGMLTKLNFDELSAMVDDKDKHEELKKHLKHMMDHHGLEIPEHSEAHMSGLAKKQAELQTHLDQIIALAAPILGVKSDEIK